MVGPALCARHRRSTWRTPSLSPYRTRATQRPRFARTATARTARASSSDAPVSAPRHDHVWRDTIDGGIHATVSLNDYRTASLSFDSAADARAVAAACTEAAEAMDRLAAGITEEGNG